MATSSIAQKLADGTLTWANSAAVNTEKTLVVDPPSKQGMEATLLIIVRNPSTVTALNGQAQVTYDDGGTTRYAKLATFTAAAGNGDGEAFIVDGGMLADGARISVKNATVLGGADGFSASVEVWQQ